MEVLFTIMVGFLIALATLTISLNSFPLFCVVESGFTGSTIASESVGMFGMSEPPVLSPSPSPSPSPPPVLFPVPLPSPVPVSLPVPVPFPSPSPVPLPSPSPLPSSGSTTGKSGLTYAGPVWKPSSVSLMEYE